MERRKFLLLASAGLTPAAHAASQVKLVENGRAMCSVYLSADASPSEQRAAAELQRFVEEMSGARLPVITEPATPTGAVVLVGRSALLDKIGPPVPYDSFGPEGFVLKTAGDRLIIAGGRLRGTMYGVYALLDKLGCRWYTQEVSRIPKRATIAIGPLEETGKPAFEYREPFFSEAFDKDWATRNRVNGVHGMDRLRIPFDPATGGQVRIHPFGHSFYSLVAPGIYFQSHPEYFSLVDGQRRAERAQLCLTNPDVLRISIESVRRWIETQPHATVFTISQNDYEGWCECDRCRRIEEEEGGAHSGPLLRFVNAVAAAFEDTNPDKLFVTLAYMYTEDAPARVRPRRNVRIWLCPIGTCQAHPYEQCRYNDYFMKNLRAWSAIARDQIYIWHYTTNFSHYLAPFPNLDELIADVPMYRRHGAVGMFLEGAYPRGGGGEMSDLRAYLLARMLWDPSLDVNRETREFLAASYGDAADTIRQYLELAHRQVRLPPRGKGQPFWVYGFPEFSDDFIAGARKLFRQAEAQAADQATNRRVRRARLPIDYVELLRAKRFFVRASSYAPADLPGLKDRFQTFVRDARSLGLQAVHEPYDLDEDEREFATYVKPYRVVTLENETLRVAVAPELGGRIVQVVHKPSGRDALRQAHPGERGYPDVAGLTLSLLPDYISRTAMIVTWNVRSAGARQAVLEGVTESGLKLTRRLELPANVPALYTETVVENAGAEPVTLTVESRFELNHGTYYPHLETEFRREDGGLVKKTLVQPGNPPSSSETYEAPQRPDGQWKVISRGARVSLVTRFRKDQASRCRIYWRARGENRVLVSLFTERRAVAPGQEVKLEAHYSIESTEDAHG